MDEWRITIGKTFQSELLNLEPKDLKLVQSHINKLTLNPKPDGQTKKKLTNWEGKVYRVRAGDYRIIYSYTESYVSLHSVRLRGKDTYSKDSKISENDLGGVKDEEVIKLNKEKKEETINKDYLDSSIKKDNGTNKFLPHKLNSNILTRLIIPKEYWDELKELKTESDLILNTPKTPDKFVTRIFEALFERNIDELLNEPLYRVKDIRDLQRFKNGELLNFLLELSEEQKTITTFGLRSEGPILVNGRAGTGKSTVAIYRVNEILKIFKDSGTINPKILFTTYSEPLISFSKQLLDQLIGDISKNVIISTADQILLKYYYKRKNNYSKATNSQLRWALDKAIESSDFIEDDFKKITVDYIIDEFRKIIIAFGIKSKIDYVKAKRAGRKVALNENSRTIIWNLYEGFMEIVSKQNWEIPENMRKIALSVITDNNVEKYDAIIVDEAQDLDPNSIRSLINLCKDEGHFFMTADANQSIYRGSFRWSDADNYFKLRGRVRNLTVNYRNTHQIMKGANDFLLQNKLEEFDSCKSFVNGPKPSFNRINNKEKITKVIINFFYSNCIRLGMSFGSCAIICRNYFQITEIIKELNLNKIPAINIDKHGLDLNLNTIKVMTCHTSKGLEFPNVIILADATVDSQDKSTSEGKEIFELEGRLMYVSMTRAMRSLKIISHEPLPLVLECNWNGDIWNLNLI